MMKTKEKKEKIIAVLDEYVPNPKCPLNYKKDYELLFAVMLSAQSTDDRVNSVTGELFKYSLEELAGLDTHIIEEIIRPVGTQKRKSEYIHSIANILLKETNSKVPHDRDFVESLPGIGHKTCNVVFSEIYNEPTFAVDTHVARVSKRLGLTSENADVVKIEQDLMNFFPKEKWGRLHVQFVLFGRYTCKAVKPLCENCPFKNKECKRPQD